MATIQLQLAQFLEGRSKVFFLPLTGIHQHSNPQKARITTTSSLVKALLSLTLRNRWRGKSPYIFPVDKYRFLVYVMLR
jgi:hypothetical protein